MGRGPGSRNRVFGQEFGRLSTELADPSKVTDPEQLKLIVYDAMLEGGGYYVVSNGSQTGDVLASRDMEEGLIDYQYEPDAPNFTPRITGAHWIGIDHSYHALAEIAILRKSPFGNWCDWINYRYPYLESGFGYCVTTYAGDGSPLPSFRGEPLLVGLPGDIDAVLERYWDCLNQDNRVSLAVKFISRATCESRIRIVNKYAKA